MRFATLPAVLLLATFALGACAADDGEEKADDLAASTDATQEHDLAQLIGTQLDPETAAENKGTKAGDPNADFDQDGIPDALEEQLLRKYRPFYKFSTDGDKTEANRPASPVAELENSQLKLMSGDSDVSDPISGCGRSGDQHLTPAASLYTCKSDTAYSKAPAVSKYCLNIADARYGGVSADEAKQKATGFYGHVVKDTVNGHAAYKIEYWQFFAFNNQDITVLGLGSFGDHEGDWTGLQLWFDTTTNKIEKIDYLIHGNQLLFNVPATFTTGATSSCKSCFQTVKGSHYNMDLGSFFDKAEQPKYSDNQAEFWLDDKGAEHVVLYVERGGHESWPGPWGKADIQVGPVTVHDNSHNGAGLGYLIADIKDRLFNLGELDHPLTADARVIMEFNGHWGCTNAKDVFGLAPQRRSPVGPAMHCEWKWPNGGKTAPGCEH